MLFGRIDKMKIREKLKYGYTLVIAMMVVITVFAVIGLVLVQGKMNDYINGAQAADTAVKECRINMNIAARNIREMALNPDQATYEKYRANVERCADSLGESLEDLKKADVISGELELSYETAIQNWLGMGYSIMDKIEDGKQTDAAKAIINECSPALEGAVEIAEQIDEETNLLKNQAVNIAKKAVVLVSAVVILILAIAIFLAARVGTRIVRSIVVPLKQIEDAAVELSKGNLHIEITNESQDEIGTLSDALRSSVHHLGTYVTDIDYAMKEFSKGNFSVRTDVEYQGDFCDIETSFVDFKKNMADMVENVQAVAEQVTRAASQISSSSTELAEGATEQAGVTKELSASIESVSMQIGKNAEEAVDISHEVQQVGKELEFGNKKMYEMVESMKRISDSSNEISKIIATINEIADQTNLLALNASIEAARAGEAGRGFAVVADQVSLLAAQSAEAAKESAALIQESVSAVKNGMVTANDTADQLENVMKGARSIISKINHIAEASKDQASEVSEINSGVDQINQVVQNNSAMSEECAAASEEMTAQAETLNEMIGRFQVSAQCGA